MNTADELYARVVEAEINGLSIAAPLSAYLDALDPKFLEEKAIEYAMRQKIKEIYRKQTLPKSESDWYEDF